MALRLDVPNQVINGVLTFSGNITATGSISLDDGYEVNGIDLSEDAVVTFGEQTIMGETHHSALVFSCYSVLMFERNAYFL